MKIEDARGRGEDAGESGYERLFGNHKLGILFSRCHATVISNGNELERILKKKVERQALAERTARTCSSAESQSPGGTSCPPCSYYFIAESAFMV